MELAQYIVSVLFGAGVAYGAIRADLKALHAEVASLKSSVTRAHRRIDEHLGDELQAARLAGR